VRQDLKHCSRSGKSAATRKTVVALVFGVVLLLNAATTAAQQHPTLVSVSNSGTGSGKRRSGDSRRYGISANGRYVVFYSEASDLVPIDASINGDIFVRDLQTGTTVLVSINADGTASGNNGSIHGMISANGRYVAFSSVASNLVSNDTNGAADVFLCDLQTGTTELVSVNASGTASGMLGESQLIDMTPDGRFVTFYSLAKDLTPIPDGNGLGTDIYVRDTLNNTTKLITVNAAGTASGNGSSFGGSISSDGRYVVVTSSSSDLVANDTATRDVFLRDLQAGTTTRLSTNVAGTAGGNGESRDGIIDRGGRLVVFSSRATDLSTLPDGNDLLDIFIYDVQAGTRRIITSNLAGTATGNGLLPGFSEHFLEFCISEDARFVAFMSQSGNLVSNDTNGNNDDIFRYEVATQTKSLVTVNLAGTSGMVGGSFSPSISADGRIVAFESLANDLVNVADHQNGFTTDVFVRDMGTAQTFLASINIAGSRTANDFSFDPIISADGSRLVFHSRASDLITNDLNGFAEDVFAFDLLTVGNPVLITEENTDRAVALDSVIQTRDPFPLLHPLNFGLDQRTRVSLFVWRLELLPGEDASAVTVLAEDDGGQFFSLPVEFVGAVSGVTNVKQVIVKLSDGITSPTSLRMKVTLRGASSNKGMIRIKAP
jgi:hypothetical protein